MTWKIDGHDLKSGERLPTLEIEADSFDGALEEARKQSKWYNQGQVIENERN